MMCLTECFLRLIALFPGADQLTPALAIDLSFREAQFHDESPLCQGKMGLPWRLCKPGERCNLLYAYGETPPSRARTTNLHSVHRLQGDLEVQGGSDPMCESATSLRQDVIERTVSVSRGLAGPNALLYTLSSS